MYPDINIGSVYMFFDEIQLIENWDLFVLRLYKSYCKNKVKLFPSFFLVKSVFHNWHEHNYQDYPHIPSQASVLALPFPENN